MLSDFLATRAQPTPQACLFLAGKFRTNLLVTVLTRVCVAARPELRDIIRFTLIALATREEDIFDAPSSHQNTFAMLQGRLILIFIFAGGGFQVHWSTKQQLPKRADLPADDQERYAYLLNHIMRIIKNNTRADDKQLSHAHVAD